MNELHLQYQRDTGIQVSKQIEFLRGIQSRTESIEVVCPDCGDIFLHYPDDDDYPEVYDYIKWLEEEVEKAKEMMKKLDKIVNDMREA